MINMEASPSGPPSVIDTEASPYNQSVVHMEASPSGPSSVINTETSPTATGQAKTGTEMLSMLKSMLVNVDLNWGLVTNVKILEQHGERPLNYGMTPTWYSERPN